MKAPGVGEALIARIEKLEGKTTDANPDPAT
jgi:BMFP domain-containing protein YqiC